MTEGNEIPAHADPKETESHIGKTGAEREDVESRLQKLLETKMTRRRVLQVGAVTGAATAIESQLHPVKRAIRRFTSSHDTREIERKIVGWVEDPQNRWPKSIKVGIDSEGLPVKYILPDGTEAKADLEKAREARQLAKDIQEPEIAQIVDLPTTGEHEDRSDAAFNETFFEPTESHPKVKELPDDVLSEEQLKEKGINIIHTDKVKLHIRKSAFQEGGSLAHLKGSGHNLNIVLLDGTIVTEELLDDEKRKSFRNLLHKRTEEIAKFRRKKIEEVKKAINEKKAGYEHYFQEHTNNNGPYPTFYANILLDAKAQAPMWENHITDGEAYMYMMTHGVTEGDFVGQYFSPQRLRIPFTDSTRRVPFLHTEASVFSSAGSAQFKSDLAYVYFDHEGTLKVRTKPKEARQNDYVESSGNQLDYTPRLSQTHPDPDGFVLNESASRDNPKSYPYAGQTPGLVLRHELAHDELIGDRRHPNHNEYDTDMLAMSKLKTAWKRWVDSKYKDDSGFSFVFETERGLIFT